MTNQQTNIDSDISRLIEMINSSDERIRVRSTDENPDLQFEVCCRLTTGVVGTTDETKSVVDAGAISILIKLIACECEELQEQAVRMLGNIINDSPENRNLAVKQGIVVPLLRFIWKSQRTSGIKIAVRVVANLCRVKNPAPDYENLLLCVPVLSCMLFHNDVVIVCQACKALADFSQGPAGNIRAIVNAGSCRRLVELLTHPHSSITSNALKTLSNIITSDDAEHMQLIIDLSILSKLSILLSTSDESTLKDIFWMISNIALGNNDHKQAIIDAGIIPVLVAILGRSDNTIKREGTLVITNLTVDATATQIKYIVEQGCILTLLNLLEDSELIVVVLTCLKVILQFGEIRAVIGGGFNSYAAVLKNCKGLKKILDLKSHTDEVVRSIARFIVNRYFTRENAYPGLIAEVMQNFGGGSDPVQELPL